MASEINGTVNERREAILAVQFYAADGAPLPVLEMLVDTGFDGSLMIPKEFADRFGLPVKGQEYYYAANDTEMKFSRTTLKIEWLGQRFDIPALIAPNDYALIGTEMLIDAELRINYARRTVSVKTE